MHQLFLLSLAILLFVSLGFVDCSCKYKGKQICEGAVTKVMKKSVRICTEGKVLKKKKEEVEPGYPMAGGGISYNRVFFKVDIEKILTHVSTTMEIYIHVSNCSKIPFL